MNRSNSYIKTIFLLGILTALLAAIGYYFGGVRVSFVFLLFGIVMNIITYWFSDRIALMMNHAKPLLKQEAAWLYEDTASLARKMNIPMPKLYVSPSAQPNAFAAGRSPEKSVVCVTTGLMQSLERREIHAVVAHELGHIRNYDVLLATVAAIVASMISSIANIAIRVSLYGSDSRGKREGGGLGGLLFLIVAPIGAAIIQLAISRSREYAADEESALATGRPRDLAEALIKISDTVKRVPMSVNPALSSLYIQNPFKGSGFTEIFSTHPRTEKRVERLLAMERKSVL